VVYKIEVKKSIVYKIFKLFFVVYEIFADIRIVILITCVLQYLAFSIMAPNLAPSQHDPIHDMILDKKLKTHVMADIAECRELCSQLEFLKPNRQELYIGKRIAKDVQRTSTAASIGIAPLSVYSPSKT
jgi:hypothetical protein